MENLRKTDTKEEEIQFLRKMLLETSKLSKDWLKSLKIVVATLSTVLIAGIVGCTIVCNMYFSYVYNANRQEKKNTSTNINQNVNRNDN